MRIPEMRMAVDDNWEMLMELDENCRDENSSGLESQMTVDENWRNDEWQGNERFIISNCVEERWRVSN